MVLAADRLLIGGDPFRDRGYVAVDRRQCTVGEHDLAYAIGDIAGRAAQIRCQLRGRDHAPSNGFPVQKLRVVGIGFERVADGVSEVEDATKSCLTLILRDDVRLHANTAFDAPKNRFCIACENLAAMALGVEEQLCVADCTGLDDFVKTGTIFTIRECGQHCGIREHTLGLMKTAEHVFAAGEVHSGLTTHTGIHLRQ